MSLARAIRQTLDVRWLTTAEVARRLEGEQDRATFYRMVNGATKEPRLGTLVRLCIALETTPSELLELAGVWSPDTPGRAGPDDLRLRRAFAEIGALPLDGKQWTVPLVAALATALGNMDEQRTDDSAPQPHPVGPQVSQPDADWNQRLETLEARLEHLESAHEGLQDAVYRQAVLEDENIGELRRRTEPGQMERDLRNARRSGL